MESKSKIFIHSSRHSQPNETTTIAVTKDIRDKIQEFVNKGETYSDILLRLYKSAKERQLHDLLMSEEGCVTAKDALERARKKWQK